MPEKNEGTFKRYQAGSAEGLDTHNGKYYAHGFKRCGIITSHLEGLVLDPFARYCPWGDITNDINTDCPTTHHMDALEFLNLMLETHGANSFRIVLMDPPFSENQSRRYEAEVDGEVSNIYTNPTLASKIFKAASKLVMPGGVLLKLGYNTTRPDEHMELVEGWTVNFGGQRQDVLMTIWKNPNSNLNSWIRRS